MSTRTRLLRTRASSGCASNPPIGITSSCVWPLAAPIFGRSAPSAQSLYRSPKHPAIDFTGWYYFWVSPIAALALLQARHLSGEAVYLDGATQTADIILGANPQSRVYLTGIGDAPVHDPMDRISLNDTNPEPLRGLTIACPTWHLPAYREPYTSANAAYWPPEQPSTDGDYRRPSMPPRSTSPP